MKCRKCGAVLTIDDENCPYCGSPNPFAVKHRASMHHFTKEFNETQSEVIEKSNWFNSITIKVTMIAVLVMICIGLAFLTANSWEISRMVTNNRINHNLKYYEETLKRYEQEQDFIGFAQFYGEHNLQYNDHFKSYQKVYRACDSYSYFYSYLMQYLSSEEEDKDRYIEYMVNQLDSIYYALERREYEDTKMYSPENVKCLDEVLNQVNILLKEYCNLTEDDLDKFPELSNMRRQMMIGRGLGLDE